MNLLEDLKQAFSRPNNTLTQLIVINIIVFVVLALLRLLAQFGALQGVYVFLYDQFSIPPVFTDFLTKPWTLITYSFAHSLSGIMHILFNMLALYWFGRIIQEYLGSEKLLHLYVLGAVAGAVVYLMSYNLIPYYADRAAAVSGMVGASAAVFAIAVGAAVLSPDYTFYLLFFGPVKIKYIVAVYVFLSILGLSGGNAGGDLAHLGGAAIGWLYISQLRSGTDLGKPVHYVLEFFRTLFRPKPKIKVSHRKKKTKTTTERKSGGSTAGASRTGSSDVSQDEIDAILDKISEKGYDSLSKAEKEKLFNASR